MLRQQLSEHQIRDLDAVLEAQPLLRLESAAPDGYTMRGAFVLHDAEGARLDSFAVELVVPKEFPIGRPVVRELNGRIPRVLNRHMFVDGNCCIQHPVAYYLNQPSRLIDYVDGPMKSYFVAQLHFEAFGTWPHGELQHGDDGLRQLCDEKLGSTNLALVGAVASLVRHWRRAKREHCPCGSGRAILKCHHAMLNALRRWPPNAVTYLVVVANEAAKS